MIRPLVAVVPVKEMAGAKQRLSPLLSPPQRQALMQVMLQDVLAALLAARGLAQVALITLDGFATELARQHGLRIITDGAREGHTGSVTAAAHVLQAESADLLQLPGDIPCVTPAEVEALVAARSAFTIAPSHDEMGSNAVLLSPPLAVPLRFGEDSYRPHLAAARAHGIEPRTLRLPGIAQDIDTPDDLAAFLRAPMAEGTRTLRWLRANALG